MEPLTPQDPREIGDFKLLCRIGAGGFGEVFLARPATGRSGLAALKVLRQDIADSERLRPRFASEVEAITRAGGRGIPELLGADAGGRRPWLATRYIPGPSLQQLVDEAGPLPDPAVWALAAALADIFRVLHADGLYHRDLKPSNILVTRSRPWVIDFSLVRLVGDPRLTSASDTMGSFQYAAPEQVDGLGRAQGEADVFALGASLLFAATGHPPRDGHNQLDIQLRALTEPPDLRGLARGALRDLLADCMEATPEQRPTPGAVLARAGSATGARKPEGLPLPDPALAVLDRHRLHLRSLTGVRDDFSAYDGPTSVRSAGPSGTRVDRGTAPVHVRWSWRCHDWLRGAPVLHRDLVLAVTASGSLHALDRSGGQERWKLALGRPARGGIARAGDSIALGTVDGSAHVVRFGSGGPVYARRPFRAPVHAVAFTRDEGPGKPPPALVVCSRRDLHLFEPAGPALRWSAAEAGVVVGMPAVDADSVYCCTDDGTLGAWGLADGTLRWRVALGGAAFSGPVVGPDGAVHAGTADGDVVAVSAETGRTRWSRRLGGTIHHSPVMSGARLLIGTVEGEVSALRSADGTVRWTARPAARGGLCALEADGDTVYGTDPRGVSALSGADGAELWRWEVGAVSGLRVDRDGLVAGGLDGILRSADWASVRESTAAGNQTARIRKKAD
ncbi:serine/threonine-protein kinase [Streptomyces sp. NPDC006733]|uniref:serine/threonine-protein kinase n=1 Tax=Streptomyces sp. NPDC006733 TaxID=3155460 RepID=UPI0033E1C1AA